jgi:hypothetical protein
LYQPDMRVFPPDQGPGYIWRLYSLTKFEESDGGVYIELEVLGLSRDVPLMLRWLVEPLLENYRKLRSVRLSKKREMRCSGNAADLGMFLKAGLVLKKHSRRRRPHKA